MLRTMSSTKPFVFMRNPRARASVEGTLHNKETTVVPIIFPKQALNITSISIAQERPPLIVATSVFKPLETKYSGMKRPDTRSSILSVNTLEKEPSLGIIVPTAKAPKREWIPIVSVTKLQTKTRVNVMHMYTSFTGSPSRERLAIATSNGLMAKTTKMTKATPQSNTQRGTNGDGSEAERAMARARRIQAATSLTAAADIAMRPTSVVRSLSSARILARTGKAVMERATPMKSIKGKRSAPLDIVARRAMEVAIPRRKGIMIPQMAMPRALRPVRRIARMSSSSPTRNKKNRRPMLASVSRTVMLFSGKTAFKNFSFRPIADGPSSIPPYNSQQHCYLSWCTQHFSTFYK